MYFCKNCGRLAHPGEDRCPKCGAAHIQPAPAATAPTGPAAPQYHPAEDAPEQDVPALGFGSTLGTLVIFMIILPMFVCRCPYCGQKLPTRGMANMKKCPYCGKELP